MRRLLALCACALVCLLCVAPAGADDTADEAEVHFRIAAKKYEANDFEGALEHFLASNRLAPNKNVVFNVARCFEQLKQPADAYRWYQISLEGATDPAFIRRSQEAIGRIRPLVALLKVETTPPGATIYLDRKDLGARGTSPRTIALVPGRTTVLAELANHELGKSESVELRQGGEATVQLALVPILGKVKVEVAKDGEGAQVRVDREDGPVLCVAPCELDAPPGRRVLYVSKAGFQTADVAVEVIAKGSVVARPRMVAQYGTIVASADVRDALVSVDGKPSGFTPTVLTVPVGPHAVRLTASGYRPSDHAVVVKHGEQVRVDAELVLTDEVAAASRQSESTEDAPASVSVITGQELRAMGYPTIAEAVRGVRGVYLTDDRSYAAVGFRGFSRPGDYGNRVLVTIDGMAINDDYLGSSYVGYDARVDLDDVERIEVIRGPGSVLYGTGAFFGVINVVTRGRDQRTHAELAAGASGEGVARARSTGVVRLGDEAGAWMTVSAARGAGRDFFFPEFVADPTSPNPERGADGRPIDGNARGLDGFDAAMLAGRAFWRSLTVQWHLNTRDKAVPTAAYGAVFGDPRNRLRDTRGFIELRFEPKLGKSASLLARAHVNLYDFDGLVPNPGTNPGTVNVDHEGFKGRWMGGELRAVLTPVEELRVTVGAEAIGHFTTHQTAQDTENGLYAWNDTPYVQVAPYVLGDVMPSKRVKLEAGARLDYFSNLSKFDFGAAFSPRLAAIFKPWKGGNVKVMGGKAFRAPSVYELYGTGVGQAQSVNLQPEQVWSGELEVSHKITETVTAAVAGYTNYVSGLIELVPTGNPGELRYANSSAPVLVGGGEAEVRREWRQGWMFGASVSVQKATYLDAPALRDVPNSPVVLGSVKGSAPILGRSLIVTTRATVEGPRPDSNNQAGDPPQQTSETGVVWDLVFSGEIEKLQARYAIGVYNIADWKWDAIPSREFRQRTIVQSGRTVLATLAVSF